MSPYPLLFHPLLKERIWGGRKLATFGKPLPPGSCIGESWEIADLPASIEGGRSIIANGALAGRSLHEVLQTHRAAIMGDVPLNAASGGIGEVGFPLLIKYLDARENLSVQVHPSAAYAAAHPGAHLKSEAWFVIQADEGAAIYKGIKPGVSAAQFRDDVLADRPADDLVRVPVRAGDCHYLPSGTCHALGAGVLVAEVQTPSDTTFRVYDWGRPATAGRELHLEQAMQCIEFGRGREVSGEKSEVSHPDSLTSALRPLTSAIGLRTTVAVGTEDFSLERVDALRDARFAIALSGRPEIWMFLAGFGRIQTSGGPTVDGVPGTTALLPAGLHASEAELHAGATVLVVKLPSPLEGMIAR